MTRVPLQVTLAGMAVLAARYQELADGFAMTSPTGVASNWQASASAVNRANRRAAKTVRLSAARMRATGAKLTATNTDYAAHETDAAHRFSQLPRRGPVLA